MPTNTSNTSNTSKTNEKQGLDPKKIAKDKICQEWMAFCIAEDQDSTVEWYRKKANFWQQNEEHLKNNGFTYSSNISHALDFVDVQKVKDLEGCLLIVKIGNEMRPASKEDIDASYAMLEQTFKGIPGIRVLVTHHCIDVQKITLPQLRRLQSEILNSEEKEDGGNPIIKDLEL